MQKTENYKQTEVGLIPEDWEVVTLGDLIKLKNGYAFSSQFYSDNGTVLITPGNFKIDGGLNFIEKNTLRYVGNWTSDQSFEIGDLLMVMTDLTPDCNLLGKAGIVTLHEPILHNQRIGKIIPVSKKVDKDYLMNFFNSSIFSSRMKSTATGSTVRHTSVPTINKTVFALPPLPEQTAIASALSDMDALIAQTEKLIEKKKAIKQGVMQELLTGKKRLKGFENSKGYKQTEVGLIPEDWEVINLDKNFTLKARIGWQGLTTSEYLQSGSFGLVTGTDFKNGFIDWDNCVFVEKSRFDQDRNIQLKIGDVLVTKDGTIGKVAFIDKLPQPTTLNSGVFVLRPISDKVENKFFYYILMSFYFDDFLKKITAGSTITHLYQKDFVHFKSICPDRLEQIAIASALSDIDDDIRLKETKLQKLKLQKQGMMQALLTGKIRLI